jgi:copper chaperone CopZ
MQRLRMAISGMSCGGCVTYVRNALGALSDTHLDAVSVESATVTYDELHTTPATIAQAVIGRLCACGLAGACGRGSRRWQGGGRRWMLVRLMDRAARSVREGRRAFVNSGHSPRPSRPWAARADWR